MAAVLTADVFFLSKEAVDFLTVVCHSDEVAESFKMAFEENSLLFGSDPTPRIVAIELGETGTVKFIAGRKMEALL